MKLISTNVTLPEDLIARVHQLWHKRCETDGKFQLWKVFRDLIQKGLEFVDWATGSFCQAPPPTSWGMHFPSICERLDPRQFHDDAGLFEALDKYTMLMTWVDLPDLQCLHASHALRDYVGYPLDRFLKLGWADLLHPDDRESTYRRCLECFRDRQPFQLVYRVRRNDGMYAWIVDSVAPRHLPDGRFGGYIGTMYEVGPPEILYAATPDARNLRMTEFLQNFKGTLNGGSFGKRQRVKQSEADIVIFEAKHHSRE